MKVTRKQLRQIIKEAMAAQQLPEFDTEIIALALRPNYARGYRVIRIAPNAYSADQTQQSIGAEARYEGGISEVAGLIADDFFGETIRVDAGGYGYGGAQTDRLAELLTRSLMDAGVTVWGV